MDRLGTCEVPVASVCHRFVSWPAFAAHLDEASRCDLTLRETLAFLSAREIARKDKRHIEMGMRIAHFPGVCTLESFKFDARPSVDPHQILDLALCRWIAHGDALLFLGLPKMDA